MLLKLLGEWEMDEFVLRIAPTGTL